jgi:FemAB-related protein (PEP-CTERM system-associated)
VRHPEVIADHRAIHADGTFGYPHKSTDVTLSISVLGHEGGSEWDAFVRRSGGWTHFHLSGWRDVLREVHGHECLYMVARDQTGAIAGVLPLVRVRSRIFGHYLVSMPFLNHGGPLGNDEAIQALAAEASHRAERDDVELLEFRSRRPLPLQMPVSHRKVGVLLDLPAGDPAVLFKRLDSKLRSQIRKPQKEGVDVRFGMDQLDAFFTVFARHMRDLGTPTQPYAFFAAIARRFPDDVWIAAAYHGGQPIAAGYGFRWNTEFEITWASSLRSYARLSPNMGLYWAMLERCVVAGVRTFNFGRSTPGAGTHRFKLQWGGRDEKLWWYGMSPGAVPAETPSPTSGAFSWGPAIWQRLPLMATNMIGPRVVRFIP